MLEHIYNPITAMGFPQCLTFSCTTLRDKHCRHPIAVMGVVDTFGSCFFKTKNRVKTLSNVIFLKKENVLTIFSQEKYTWLWLQMAQFMTTWILWVFPTFMGHLQHILKIIILTKPGLGKFEKWLHVERNFYHSSSKIRKKKTKEWFPDFFFKGWGIIPIFL